MLSVRQGRCSRRGHDTFQFLINMISLLYFLLKSQRMSALLYEMFAMAINWSGKTCWEKCPTLKVVFV